MIEDESLAAEAHRFVSRHGDLFACLLCLVYLAYAGSLLTSLLYNFDEGVYIQQARLILEGQRPYADFFIHQTPFYPLTLAAFAYPAPDSLWIYRLLSLLATVVCGFAVYRIAAHLVTVPWALLALLLFLAAPLQYYDLLALPAALMVSLSTVGFYLVWCREERMPIAIGAVCLVAAILYKPPAIATGVGIGLALLVVPSARRKAPLVLLTGTAAGVLAWGGLHLLSRGLFTEMLMMQSSRIAGGITLDFLAGFEPFAQELARRGVESTLQWNLQEHSITLFSPSRWNWPFATMGIAGLAFLWAAPQPRWKEHRIALSLWGLVPLASCIWIWQPTWDHYFVQYLPALAILAMLHLHSLWNTRPMGVPVLICWIMAFLYVGFGVNIQGLLELNLQELMRIGLRLKVVTTLLLLLLPVAIAAGLLPRFARVVRPWAAATVILIMSGMPGMLLELVRDYSELSPPSANPGEERLTLDPFLNFITGTRPACGIVDPLNVYGTSSLINIILSSSGEVGPEESNAVQSLRSHYVAPAELIDCLQADPELEIAISSWGTWFIDDELRAYLDRLPPERLLSAGF